MLKTLIVGTRKNRFGKAVLTSTHNLCFGSKIRKICILLQTPVFLYIKVGFRGGGGGEFILRTCFPDVVHFTFPDEPT